MSKKPVLIKLARSSLLFLGLLYYVSPTKAMDGNLVPFALAGFGAREAMAVFFLRRAGLCEADVFSSFFLVAVIDLVIPSLAGVWAIGPALGPVLERIQKIGR